MFLTKGYITKKVWKDGKLKEDIEAIERGNDSGIKLVIRDKDQINAVKIPKKDILRTIMEQPASNNSLEERLMSIISKRNGRNRTRKNINNLGIKFNILNLTNNEASKKRKTKSKRRRSKTAKKSGDKNKK